MVKESGHNIHIEKAREFNAKINEICEKADQGEQTFADEKRHSRAEIDYRL